MSNIKDLVLIPQGGKGTPDIKSLVRSKRKNLKIKIPIPNQKHSSKILTPQYKNFQVIPDRFRTVSVMDVQVSVSTYTLYDYLNRDSDIEDLMKSISGIGQQEPILVIRKDDKYIVIDGVLRLKAICRLGIDTIDVVISDLVVDNEFLLANIIIHHHIDKLECQKSLKSLLSNNNELNLNNQIKAGIKILCDTFKMSA